MTPNPPHDRSMKMDYLLSWTMNVFLVAVFPATIGFVGAPLWSFLGYAVVAGIVLTLVEDVSFVRTVFERADVRGYLKVRIVLVMVCGIIPFLIGSVSAG